MAHACSRDFAQIGTQRVGEGRKLLKNTLVKTEQVEDGEGKNPGCKPLAILGRLQ